MLVVTVAADRRETGLVPMLIRAKDRDGRT